VTAYRTGRGGLDAVPLTCSAENVTADVVECCNVND